MAYGDIAIRARKFIANPLLRRKQFVLDVYHPSSGTVSRDALCAAVADKFGCAKQNVVVFGFKTKFGGGKSTGFGLIYDSLDALKKYEPNNRLIRNKLIEKVAKKGRRLKKEEKNKKKKLFGVKKED